MREASPSTPSLPDDPTALRALLLTAWAERGSAAAERDSIAVERDALAARNERLQHLLRKLQRMQFGRRSEQLTDDQLQFAFAEVEASIAETEAEAEKHSPDLREKNAARRRAGCGRLPEHLLRIEQVLLPMTAVSDTPAVRLPVAAALRRGTARQGASLLHHTVRHDLSRKG